MNNSCLFYFIYRAAANSKLDNHQAALEDCRIAIKHDPNYSKAYCRMGLAYVNLNDHLNARNSYKKAVDLDPSENNISNLNLAEQKLKVSLIVFVSIELNFQFIKGTTRCNEFWFQFGKHS